MDVCYPGQIGSLLKHTGVGEGVLSVFAGYLAPPYNIIGYWGGIRVGKINF